MPGGVAPDAVAPERVALLHAGEMGAALATLLLELGHQVATTTAGRGPATVARARDRGLQIADDLPSLVADATVILSVVPPVAAIDVAVGVAEATATSGPRRLYIDLNSIAPRRMAEVVDVLADRPIDVVDATIHGPSSRLRDRSVLYLSGAESGRVAALFGGVIETRMLGLETGRASAMKMAVGGLSKGLSALFLETAAFASRAGLLDEWLEECRRFYPAVVTALEPMVPTYAIHADRRADELGDLVATAHDLGLAAEVAAAAQRVVSRLADGGRSGSVSQDVVGFEVFVQRVARSHVLDSDPTDTGVTGGDER